MMSEYILIDTLDSLKLIFILISIVNGLYRVLINQIYLRVTWSTVVDLQRI